MVMALSELMPNAGIDLASSFAFMVPEMLEAYRQLVVASGLPYAIPARYIKALMERVLAESHPDDAAREKIRPQFRNTALQMPAQLVEKGSYGKVPLMVPGCSVHRWVTAPIRSGSTTELKKTWSAIPGRWATMRRGPTISAIS